MGAVPKRFLRVPEFADAMGCSRQKAYLMIASGAVRAIKIDGLLRVPVTELDRLEELVSQLKNSDKDIES